MSKAKVFLKEELKLKMQTTKSKLIYAPQEFFEFLGYFFMIYENKGHRKGNIIFGPPYKSIDKFKDKIREMTKRNQTNNTKRVIASLKQKLKGGANYFGIGYVKYLFKNLDGWITIRIRIIQLRSW